MCIRDRLWAVSLWNQKAWDTGSTQNERISYWWCIWPVSYTHLDVYKRQGIYYSTSKLLFRKESSNSCVICMERIKNYLINFMRGRYGIDQMSQTLFIAALIFILFAGFTQNFLFEMIGIALFAYADYRALSKNIPCLLYTSRCV